MIKLLEYHILPLKSASTFITVFIVFEIDKFHEYYECFNRNPILQHEDGYFKYFAYLEDCNSVKGLILDLEDLKNNVGLKSNFSEERRLLAIIESLANFWH